MRLILHWLINAAAISHMQPHALFVNISRGDVVDEAALIVTLAERRIAGAGLDVYEFEPKVPADLMAMENVTLRTRCMAAGVYDHGYVLADQKVADHTPGDGRPKHRLWRIRAGKILTATGAIERPISFAGNDIPGVMLAASVRDYVVNWAVSPGDRTVVVTNNDDG